MKGLQNQVRKIKELKTQSLWQELGSFLMNMKNPEKLILIIQGVPSALLAANYSLNNTDNQDSPKLPPRLDKVFATKKMQYT